MGDRDREGESECARDGDGWRWLRRWLWPMAMGDRGREGEATSDSDKRRWLPRWPCPMAMGDRDREGEAARDSDRWRWLPRWLWTMAMAVPKAPATTTGGDGACDAWRGDAEQAVARMATGGDGDGCDAEYAMATMATGGDGDGGGCAEQAMTMWLTTMMMLTMVTMAKHAACGESTCAAVRPGAIYLGSRSRSISSDRDHRTAFRQLTLRGRDVTCNLTLSGSWLRGEGDGWGDG